MTRRLIRSELDAAAAALRSGGVVVMPTETVYGLAADATDPAAFARIFSVKGRPPDHPLIVHLAEPEDLLDWAPEAGDAARRLASMAWPGPLTIIVPRSSRLPAAVAGGRDSVGLRVPAHPMARELIRLAGVPLAAPSANLFGSVSPTTVEHVIADLAGRLDPERDAVVDGGPCPVGVESTIVDTTVEPVQILRAGAVTHEQVVAVLGADVAPASGPSRASGMLASHYAPRCRVVLAESVAEAQRESDRVAGSRVLDPGHDLGRAARDLFAELRQADTDGVSTLFAVLPPAEGIGHAIRDRLSKAAAPRPTS
ncbi:MAG: L-threonylcarbamoyladenylate synthase [Ilumatobacter sp.]